MEEGKKLEEQKEEDKKTEGEKPIITRSMTEEASCAICVVEDETAMPANLPDPSWPTEKLVEALKDKHMLVRSNAVMLLSKKPLQESIEPLIEALKDKDYLVKSNAMVALSSFGRQIFDRMITALSDQDPDVRAGAAWILGELKDQRAIDALEKAAKDDYPLARIQAKASLMSMGVIKPKKVEKKAEPAEKPEETSEKAEEKKD
ncbi:MAG: HEAT repeat domain-containing protein [Methanotrichaceae archaeon]